MIAPSEFYGFPAGFARLREVGHHLRRAAAAEGAMGKIIPRVLDHRQQGIDLGFLSAEKLDQVDKQLARVRRPVVRQNQLLDVLDGRFALEGDEKI